MKKVMAIGDLHCGSMVGLTHPDWIIREGRDKSYYDIQVNLWNQFNEIVDAAGTVDALIVNGDVVDGKGCASGGTEQITTDMLEQTDMAIAAISQIDFKKAFFTYGTPYHVTTKSGEDFEKIVANAFNAPIEDETNVEVDGVLFNAKHKLGTSPSSFNRATAISKQHIWDVLNSHYGQDPTIDVFLRSHVHFYFHCDDSHYDGFILPALQASATKFGARQCYGSTDCGVMLFYVEDGKLESYGLQRIELDCSKKTIHHC